MLVISEVFVILRGDGPWSQTQNQSKRGSLSVWSTLSDPRPKTKLSPAVFVCRMRSGDQTRNGPVVVCLSSCQSLGDPAYDIRTVIQKPMHAVLASLTYHKRHTDEVVDV